MGFDKKDLEKIAAELSESKKTYPSRRCFRPSPPPEKKKKKNEGIPA